jgi:hypothetical protein
VTSTTRNALSSNIADYNAFVSAVATAVPELNAPGTTWWAIASSPTVDARDNTSTNHVSDGVGVPVYNLGGFVVANGNVQLWSGGIVNSIRYTESGTPLVAGPWTGSDAIGTARRPA